MRKGVIDGPRMRCARSKSQGAHQLPKPAFTCKLGAACSCQLYNVDLGEGVGATVVVDFATETI